MNQWKMGKGATMENLVIHRHPAKSWLLLCAFLILFGLAGCSSPTGSAVLSKIETTGAEEADKALSVAIWGTCKAPTAGALTRKWGSDPEAFKKWAAFCDYVTFPVNGG